MELISFILSYFITKDLSMMTAFICWTPERTSELCRSASGAGVRLQLATDFHQPPPMTPRGRFREAMLLDLTCPHAALIMEAASSSRGFNYRHSWLLLHNSSERALIADALSPYEILPDADVVWSAPDALLDVYKIKPATPYLLTDLGLTRNCSRHQLRALWAALPSAVTRRRDLKNVTMKGISVVTEPYNFKGWSDLRNRQIDTFPKFTYPLMMLAAQDMHFRFDLRQMDLYGVSHNGSFDGLVGRLQRNDAEVGLASIFIRPDRMQVADYISETCVLLCAFIFRQPARSAVSNVFLAPFSAGVWAASAGVAAAAALLLVALRAVLQRTRQRDDLALFTLPETLTFALGTLCQQGFHTTPGVTSVRLVMFSTLLASLFVFTAYSAKIVAILQTPSDALRTIDDLTRSPITIGVQDTTYKKVYFLESPDESTQQLYRRKILPQGERAYHSVVDGIARVRTGLFAFQVESSSGYDIIRQTFTEREKCSLKEIEAFKLPLVAVPMRKNSGYRELFATRLRWQREVGLMSRERRVWLVSRPRCDAAGGGFVSIGIGDVLPALQVLGLGALISLTLLAAELAAHAIRNSRRWNHI
ncbi:ionotropic receptor 75a-like isoform X2 [Helicoverpa zea]|uniref:ionotropic receptor 75a-like isoform X2 n=1 Tax=Helicoverpa zea TaxID=7113 RepID=UPI001F55EB96|nr:ionotropic receptor 75a-like isoform X2 [Helicoverpa zea]